MRGHSFHAPIESEKRRVARLATVEHNTLFGKTLAERLAMKCSRNIGWRCIGVEKDLLRAKSSVVGHPIQGNVDSGRIVVEPEIGMKASSKYLDGSCARCRCPTGRAFTRGFDRNPIPTAG